MALKRAIVRASQKYLVNPSTRVLARRGLLGDYVLLETIGRKTGQRRETPVGMKIKGDEAWMVSEHGRHSGYVKNIEANPRVRVKTGGEWRQGSAHLLDDDDPVARLKALWGNAGNALPVRMFGTDLLTIRIDFDDQDQCGASPK
ncbi:MAG: nitroreductase family deazaflavin-dependent oxidoreductase [Actinobacteria bacterium]|nr:nitroreductase family deazaflavin-dependent oxidoreductase [Actinomycetota bacterium]